MTLAVQPGDRAQRPGPVPVPAAVRALGPKPVTVTPVPADRFQSATAAPRDGTLVVRPEVAALSQPSKGPAAGRGHLAVQPRFQGKEWSCGTSALYVTLRYLNGAAAGPFATLDTAVRPTRTFGKMFGTAPGSLAGYARSVGMAATVHNHGTTDDLRRMIDKGLPAILLGDRGSRHDFSMHYRVVTGYSSNHDSLTIWTLADALRPDLTELKLTTPELLAFWSSMKFLGKSISYDRVIVGVAPQAQARDLPGNNLGVRAKLIDGVFHKTSVMLRGLETVIGGRIKPGAAAASDQAKTAQGG